MTQIQFYTHAILKKKKEKKRHLGVFYFHTHHSLRQIEAAVDHDVLQQLLI